MREVKETAYCLDEVDQKILEKLPERPKRSHKGMFGKALCIQQ